MKVIQPCSGPASLFECGVADVAESGGRRSDEMSRAGVLHPADAGRPVSTDQGSTQFATVDTDGNLIALHNDAPAPEGQFYPSLDGRGRTIEIGSARRLPSPLTDRPALGRTTQEPIGPHMITPAAARAPNTIGLAVIERTIKDSWVRARACTGVDTATVRR